jgi:hypothetical protein
MGYDRNLAIDYAKRFWDRPCDDGVFWLNDRAVNVEHKRRELNAPAAEGWEPRFVPDGHGAEEAVFQRTRAGAVEKRLIQGWNGLADCAHFLSKCLTTGGVRIADLAVPKLVSDLQARQDTKTFGEKVDLAAGQRIVDSGVFSKGDMIGYFNIDPAGDYGGAVQYSHSTMYVGKLDASDPGRITCHTKSRFPGLSAFPDEWYLDAGSYKYTFIHLSADDVAPTRQVAAGLEGWWRVQFGAQTYYYFLFPDGRARWRSRPPRSKAETLHDAEGSAYWFRQLDKTVFFWRKSGSVEVWSVAGGVGSFRTVLNGGSSGTASKL